MNPPTPHVLLHLALFLPLSKGGVGVCDRCTQNPGIPWGGWGLVWAYIFWPMFSKKEVERKVATIYFIHIVYHGIWLWFLEWINIWKFLTKTHLAPRLWPIHSCYVSLHCPPMRLPIIFSISEHDFGCLITFLDHNIYEVKLKQVIEYLLNLGFTASGTMATKTGCFWKAYILGFSLGTGAPAQHCIAAVKTSCKIIWTWISNPPHHPPIPIPFVRTS